jgi:hypothetical protein
VWNVCVVCVWVGGMCVGEEGGVCVCGVCVCVSVCISVSDSVWGGKDRG